MGRQEMRKNIGLAILGKDGQEGKKCVKILVWQS